MLKTTIPTLEINTAGTDLSLMQTLFVTIKQGDVTTLKSNDDIEVDNSVISVSLTREEAEQFRRNSSSVSVKATGKDGNTYGVRVAWVKLGSRTDYESSGAGGSGGGGTGGVSSDELKNYYTKEEIGEKLNDYSTDAEVDEKLKNYYTKEKINEIVSGLGSGSVFEVCEWYVISNDGWNSTGSLSWNNSSTSNSNAVISLAIYVPKNVKTKVVVRATSTSVKYSIYLNNATIFSGTADSALITEYDITLRAGTNNLQVVGLTGRNYTTFNLVNVAVSEGSQPSVSEELTAATSTELGGIKADEKTENDTVAVKIGTDEKLYVPTYPKSLSELQNDSGYQTANQVSTAIRTATGSMATQEYVSQQIALAPYLRRTIVASLPELSDADEKTVYMVPKEGKEGDIFNEYMFINGAFEFIGTSAVDLSDYVKKTDIQEIGEEEIENIWNSVFGEGDAT